MKKVFLFAGTSFSNYQYNRQMIQYLLDALICMDLGLMTYGYEGGPVGDILNFAEKKRVKLISIYCNEMRHRHVRSRKFSELQLQCNNLIEQKDLIFSQSDMMILLPGSDIEAQTDFLLMRQFMIYKNQLKPMAVYNVANSYEHFSELLKMNEPFPYEDLDSKLIIESNPWKIILRITELSQRLICAKH